MALFISKANSIDFSLVDSNDPNRQNTRSFDEKHAAFQTVTYCQKFIDSDVVTVQVGSDTDTVPTIEVFQPELELASPITATLKTSYAGVPVYYFEFDVDFSNYTDKTIQVKVTQSGTVWLSEKLVGDLLQEEIDDGYYLKLQCGNASKPSDYRNFQIDYTTNISFFMYLPAILKDPDSQGEDEVFEGLDSNVLLEAIVYVGMVLKVDKIPSFLFWKLHLWGKHFYFIINTLQWVTVGNPEIGDSQSNLFPVTWTLTQKDPLGINTDNIGISTDDMEPIIVRKKEDLTTTWSFVQPEGYILHAIYADHASASAAASYTFKTGYTVGGEDIIAPFITNIVKTEPVRPFVLHEQKTFDADTTIYIEIVVGVGAIGRIYVNLLLNT